MSNRTIDWDALVKRIDPKLKTEPQVEFVFGGGRVVKTAPPNRDGKPYWWLRE